VSNTRLCCRLIQGKLTHPQILAALARAGHGSKVLISDGNYPHSTAKGPNAEVVYLNLSPGICTREPPMPPAMS
jgi:L-fucose mutarotase